MYCFCCIDRIRSRRALAEFELKDFRFTCCVLLVTSRSFAHGAKLALAHGVVVGRKDGFDGLPLLFCCQTKLSLPEPLGLGRSNPYVFRGDLFLSGGMAWYTFAVKGMILGAGYSDIKSRPVPFK